MSVQTLEQLIVIYKGEFYVSSFGMYINLSVVVLYRITLLFRYSEEMGLEFIVEHMIEVNNMERDKVSQKSAMWRHKNKGDERRGEKENP